jgi:ATP-dependent Lon protease
MIFERDRDGEVEGKDLIGVVTGLVWTDVGGELLTSELMQHERRLVVQLK